MEELNILEYGDEQEFAKNVKNLIIALFQGDKLPAKIKGKSSQIKVFSQALIAETAYLRCVMQFGEEHPESVKLEAQLDTAIRRFERVTGIEWPIK